VKFYSAGIKMQVKKRLIHIASELKVHAPFTVLGAVMGIAFMFVFRNISKGHAEILFGIFHPGHILLSAMVTASIFAVHLKKKKFMFVLVVAYFGSIGVATLSDSIVPYIGAKMFTLEVPTHDHGADEEHNDQCSDHGGHDQELHLGFLEHWYVVHIAAIIGILLGWFTPHSKCPHGAHVLLSTWASSAHILMNSSPSMTLPVIAEIFAILFIAVWLPCCISDIVFPLFFVDSDMATSGLCACHGGKKRS
jgi:hypothetical protein